MLWILGYCSASWLAGIAFVTWCLRTCEDERTRAVASAHPVAWALAGLLLVLLAPLYLPFALLFVIGAIVLGVRENRRLVNAARQYREPEFRPVNFFDLDEVYRRGFEDRHGEFLSLGFELLGDFQNKRDPLPVYNRCYVGLDGAVFADMTALLESSTPGMMSILADGTYIETSATEDCELSGELVEEDKISVHMVGEVSVEELLREHLELIEQQCEQRGTRLLSFPPECLQDLVIYGQRRFWSWRQRCGEKTGEIPAAILPSGQVVEMSPDGLAGSEVVADHPPTIPFRA